MARLCERENARAHREGDVLNEAPLQPKCLNEKAMGPGRHVDIGGTSQGETGRESLCDSKRHDRRKREAYRIATKKHAKAV